MISYKIVAKIQAITAQIWHRVKTDFAFRNILKPSALIKICLFYAIIIFSIIALHFDLPQTGEQDITISFYSSDERIGESELYNRALKACSNLNWCCFGAKLPEYATMYSLPRHFFNQATNLLNFIYQPEFNIALTHHVYITPSGFNFTYINIPTEMIVDINGDFLDKVAHLKNYDGYIDLNSFANNNDISWLRSTLNKYGKGDDLIIPAYIVLPQLEYKHSPPKYMLLTGSLWGCNRSSLRVKQILKHFADQKQLFAYGLKKHLGFLGAAFQGQISTFNPDSEMIINLHRQYGIGLAIHNAEHLIEQIPTNRIAEIIASGSILITDNHGFVRNNFGSNALYFNSFNQTEYIIQEITAHLNWIQDNPEQVAIMTKNAFDIFMRKFSMEIQLQNIYEKYKAYQKNMQKT